MRHFSSVLCLFTLLNVQIRAAENADWIIRARYVVTMDARHRIINQGAVAIRGTRIVGVGPQREIGRHYEATYTLDKPDALVAPGLIDTHTHAPMSLFRAIADDMRLQNWLTKF